MPPRARNIPVGRVYFYQNSTGRYSAIWRSGNNSFHYTTPTYAFINGAAKAIARHNSPNINVGTANNIQYWLNNSGIIRVPTRHTQLHSMLARSRAERTNSAARSLLRLAGN